MLKARWQLPLHPPDTSEGLTNAVRHKKPPPIKSSSRKDGQPDKGVGLMSRAPFQDNQPEKIRLPLQLLAPIPNITRSQLNSTSATNFRQRETSASVAAAIPILARSQSVPLCSPLPLRKENEITSQMSVEAGDISHLSNIHRMDEFERKTVRKTQLIINPDGSQADCKDSIRYIRPQERHKYDIATSRRLAFLKRSIPADSTASVGRDLLNGAYSTNSRKSALHILVEMNNRKVERSLKVKPNLTLQKKLSDFLKSLDVP